MDSVFTGPVWVLVGHESEIPNPGDYKTISVGAIPVIVVRGVSGRVGVLVNACAHRGTRLVEGPSGNVHRGGFRCIYHMWTYDTEGRLIAVSLPEDFPTEFRKEDYGLPRARVEAYRGALFATFHDGAPPLREYLAEMSEGLDRVLGDGALRYLGSIRVIFRTNWKLYVENIYDGYHVTALHTGFQVVRLRSHGGERLVPNYERNGHLWGRSKSTPVKELTPALRDMSLFDTRTKPTTDHNMMVVFPSGVVTDYFDTIQLRYVVPLALDRTQIEFAFFGRETDIGQGRHPAVGEPPDDAEHSRLEAADPDLNPVQGSRPGMKAARRVGAALEIDRALPAPEGAGDLDGFLQRCDFSLGVKSSLATSEMAQLGHCGRCGESTTLPVQWPGLYGSSILAPTIM